MTWLNRLKLLTGIVLVIAVVAMLTILFNQRQNQVNSLTASIDAPTSPVGSGFGGTVLSQRVNEGDHVTKGQQLFTVYSVSLQQAVQQGAKPTSTDAFTVDTANARVTYKAVTDGYIADLKGVTGAYIPDGQSLAEVVSDSSRYVKAIYRLNPADYGRIERGAPVTIILPNMQTVTGQVETVTVETENAEAITTVTVTSGELKASPTDTLTRKGTPVTAEMRLRDDGWLAGPTQSVLSFLTKIGLR